MLIRWTIPRFRFDQLMGLAWKVLIPLSLANVVVVMTVLQFGLEPLVVAADFDRAVRVARCHQRQRPSEWKSAVAAERRWRCVKHRLLT